MAKAKRKCRNDTDSRSSNENTPSNNKKRKVERKQDQVTDQVLARFDKSIEKVLKLADDSAYKTAIKEDEILNKEILLDRKFLQDLSGDASKLKKLDKMQTVSLDKLVIILNVLELHMRGGNRKLMIPQEPGHNKNEQISQVNTDLQAVTVAVESCLICLYIMTSKNMPKRVYMEEVIERIIKYTMYQLHNSIFPFFDAAYFTYSKKVYKKSQEAIFKDILILYMKLVELINLLMELVDIQLLETPILMDIVSMCISSLFVESVTELEFCASNLLIKTFNKYESVRKMVFDKLLLTMSSLPNQEQGCKKYQLDSGESIEMLTAVIMQLIQALTCHQNTVQPPGNKQKKHAIEKDALIRKIHFNVISTAGMFLEEFLKICFRDVDTPIYKKLFEHFINDLLLTAFKPEWPSADVMLCLTGKLLVDMFSNVDEDLSFRAFTLESLGRIAVNLRKRNIEFKFKADNTKKIVESLMTALENNNGDDKETVNNIYEEQKINMLQKVLIDFLAVNSKTNENYIYALNFYVSQWYRDLPVFGNVKPTPGNGTRKSRKSLEKQVKDTLRGKQLEFLEQRKMFLLNNLASLDAMDHLANRALVIDYHYAVVISEVLASKRYFFNSFEQYLLKILDVLKDDSTSMRTKAVKCLNSIIDTDLKILENDEVKLAINITFVDRSAAVRETALNLIGKFVEGHPDLLNEYYDTISARILDAGLNVRKCVIKILKSVVLSNRGFENTVDVILKIVRRVKDEDSIKKLIVELFQEMWFNSASVSSGLEGKAEILLTVVERSGENDLELLEKLLSGLFNPKEFYNFSRKSPEQPSNDVEHSYREIFSYISSQVDNLTSKNLNKHVPGLFKTINLLSKVKPELLEEQIMKSLAACLENKDGSLLEAEDLEYICYTLETGLPFVQNNKKLLRRIERECLEMCLTNQRPCPETCISVIAKIVNKYTHNYEFIKQCFTVQFSNMTKFRLWMDEDNLLQLNKVENVRKFVRSLFIVGNFFKYFDMTAPQFDDPNLPDKEHAVYKTLLYFLPVVPMRNHILRAIGAMCCRHYNLLLDKDLRSFYKEQLLHPNANETKIQILANMKSYLLEEKSRIVQQDLEWQDLSKEQSLKEMVDASSGMASCIMQIYIDEVMQSYPSSSLQVRQLVHQVIQLTLEQGLVQTVRLVPYFMCMATDPDKVISYTADEHLLEVARTYPHFIHTKASLGLWFSYLLHSMLNKEDHVRGFVFVPGANPTALNGYFYSLIRKTRMYRHSFLLNILKKFDQADISLSYKLYLADHLAYFSYQVLEEPLFIFHNIDIVISVSGTNILETFLEGLVSSNTQEGDRNSSQDEDASVNIMAALDAEEEDVESLLERMPEDLTDLRNTVTCIQGYLLLPLLTQYLKDVYCLHKSKVPSYCPGQSSQFYEKPIMRKSNRLFEPESILQIAKRKAIAENSEEEKMFLIDQYSKFKKLIMDTDDDVENRKPVVNRSTDLNATKKQNSFKTSKPIKTYKNTKRNSKNTPGSKKRPKANKKRFSRTSEEDDDNSSDSDFSL